MDGARVFLASGGGDAIDAAAKIARRHWIQQGQPERVHLISRTQGYHGTHGFGTSIGGIEANTSNWGPLVPHISSVAFDSLPALEAEIERVGPDKRGRLLLRAGDRRRRRPPAARGLHRGRRRPVRRARDPVRRRQRHLRLRPARDLVRDRALGGRAPGHDHVRQGRDQRLPAARRRRRLRRASPAPFFEAPGGPMLRHGATYAGHPTCCAAALAVLDIYERDGLIERGRELEGPLADALAPLADHPAVAEVRAGLGLLAAVQLAPEVLERDAGAVAQGRRGRARGRGARPPAARRRRRLAAAHRRAGAPRPARRGDPRNGLDSLAASRPRVQARAITSTVRPACRSSTRPVAGAAAISATSSAVRAAARAPAAARGRRRRGSP